MEQYISLEFFTHCQNLAISLCARYPILVTLANVLVIPQFILLMCFIHQKISISRLLSITNELYDKKSKIPVHVGVVEIACFRFTLKFIFSVLVVILIAARYFHLNFTIFSILCQMFIPLSFVLIVWCGTLNKKRPVDYFIELGDEAVLPNYIYKDMKESGIEYFEDLNLEHIYYNFAIINFTLLTLLFLLEPLVSFYQELYVTSGYLLYTMLFLGFTVLALPYQIRELKIDYHMLWSIEAAIRKSGKDFSEWGKREELKSLTTSEE